MRICIDIDGVICELRVADQNYADLEPISGATEVIRKLRNDGHYIILQTARHMKTTESNVGAVLARQGMVTLKWLQDHGIEYDEIYFGKPWADLYIDDNALRFTSWNEVVEGLKN
ncbi:MAG: capsular biosynthesis protein [Actinobacteria bacterium]|nr:capsular biosynthesis protein [Actinomycetota bacterium]